jgi:hypothetical protein
MESETNKFDHIVAASVSINIFSGRENPTWNLVEAQTAEFVARLKSSTPALPVKEFSEIGKLGYSGITVRLLTPNSNFAFLIYQEFIHEEAHVNNQQGRLINSNLEEWLFSLAESVLEPVVFNEAKLEREQSFRSTRGNGWSSTLNTTFDPSKWNNDWSIRASNNCYNYANDKITNTFAQPGRGSGKQYEKFRCADIIRAAVNDGEVDVMGVQNVPIGSQLIALVVAPDHDFHWYRLDADNHWSHKPGTFTARNFDNSQNLILSPETCDRGRYSNFCGYFVCSSTNVRIE